jgi:tetratricopeptide (TPR) repeat protein
VKIGPYEILGELGRGGMGVVYRVRATDGRVLALKRLREGDAATHARFDRERRLLSSLGEGQGFVGLLDVGFGPEGLWLVMPFVPGGTLRDRLARGPLGIEETVRLGVELAKALGAAHERGIVHRDVKPENVLFTATGRALLADLGLAKHFDRGARGASQSVSLTQDGIAKGTAGYMAPEQLHDSASVGPPADVFSLGATLYECLAGRPAFEGEGFIETLAKLESGVVTPIGRPALPDALEKAVFRALAKDPRERFADGGSLARALAPGKTAKMSRAAPLAAGIALGLPGLAIVVGLALAGGSAPPAPPAPPRPPPAPVKPADGPSPEVLALVTRGNERLRAGDGNGALADAEEAVKLAPRLARAWLLRGVVHGTKGERDRAIDDLTRAIELDPKLALAYTNRANGVWGKGDNEGAFRDATTAIELDPSLAQAWAIRSGARLNLDDLQGTIVDASKAIELDPGFAMAWMNRANAKLDLHDRRGAIEDASRAIDLSPDAVVAWATRGAARSELGEYDDAIKDLDRALALVPTSPMILRDRGTAKLRKGDFAGAREDFERCLSLPTDNVYPDYVRGLLEEAKRGAR